MTNNWTIDAHRTAAASWDYVTYNGLPAETLWRTARSHWQINLHGHSFAVFSLYDRLTVETAQSFVDRFFTPSTDRLCVDLSQFDGYSPDRDGVKNR